MKRNFKPIYWILIIVVVLLAIVYTSGKAEASVVLSGVSLSSGNINIPVSLPSNDYDVQITCSNGADLYNVMVGNVTGGVGGTPLIDYKLCSSYPNLQSVATFSSTGEYTVYECVSGFENNTDGSCSIQDSEAHFTVSNEITPTATTSINGFTYGEILTNFNLILISLLLIVFSFCIIILLANILAKISEGKY